MDASRALAEWAAEDDRRGCALMPLPGPGAERAVAARARDAVAVIVRGDEPVRSGFVSLGGYRAEPEEAVVGSVASQDAPVGLAVTGHGAEFCVRFGEGWLTPDARVAPEGPAIEPGRVRAPVVFLNCCGSLRMGDSVVPRELSLAAKLYERGASVVGAFRNRHAVADAEEVFAAALLEGLPVGAVVNRLNRRGGSDDGRPAFQALGDAAHVPHRGGGRIEVPPSARPDAGLDEVIAEVVRLDRLYRTLSRWVARTGRVNDVHASFGRLMRSLFVADRAAAVVRLDDEDRAMLVGAARWAASELRHALADDIAAAVRDHWLDELYVPYYRAPRPADGTCPECGSVTTRFDHAPYLPDALDVRRVECDRCGTRGDWVGAGDRGETELRAVVADGEIVVSVPPLPDRAAGRVLVRKTTGSERGWPDRAAALAYPLHTLPKRGRLVVAAVSVGDGWAAVEYRTVFAPPG